MTRIEAENEAKELNKVKPKWFCPLIIGDCNPKCVNFIPAYVEEIEHKSNGMLHDIKDDNFHVVGFVCSNAAFIGDLLPCMGE